MGKKDKRDKMESKMELRLWDEQQKGISIAKKELYPDGELESILPSSDGDVLKKVMEKALSETSTQRFITQDEMEEHCHQVRDYVKQGKEDNIEIRLDNGTLLFLGKKYELGDVIIKTRTFDGDISPTCIFIKAGGTLDARLFIGGESVSAVLATRTEKGDEHFTRLSEFHMFSLQKNPEPKKEVGLVTSYVWLTARIYLGIYLGYNFEPIRSLLLAEWLHLEWQRAKEAREHSAGAKIGGDANG